MGGNARSSGFRNTNRNTVCISCARHPFDTGLVPIKSMRNRGTHFGAACEGRGVRGWTRECIPSSSVVAGPRVPPPAFNRHPVQFIRWADAPGPRFRGSCHKTLRLPTATRRVRSTPRDVNRRRLQNEPCFGVDHRKVTRLPFRRNSCPLARVSCFGTAFGL